MQTCPDCHSLVDDDAIFCDQCGFRLKPKPPEPAAPIAPSGSDKEQPFEMVTGQALAQTACPSCGYVNQPDETFCVNCGMQLVKVEAPPPQPPVEKRKQANPLKSCPVCGADNLFKEPFCRNCGYSLTPRVEVQPEPMPSPLPPAKDQSVEQAPPAFVVESSSSYETATTLQSPGRLLSTATNTSLALPAKPEIVIGRQDPEKSIYPDVDLSAQGSASSSVSRQHARLFVQGSQVFVEDLNSTNSTYLNRQRLQPGQRYLLNQGDELRLGGVILVFYTS